MGHATWARSGLVRPLSDSKCSRPPSRHKNDHYRGHLGRWAPQWNSPKHSRNSGTIPEISNFFGTLNCFPIYESSYLDHFGAPRNVLDLIRDSEQSFGTTILISHQTLATLNVKCVTLRVREYVDMIETPLRSIINSGNMDVHNDSHIFNEDRYRFEPQC